MKEGVIKMVLYLHKHYKGSFSLDVWSESLGQFEVLPYYGNIDGSMEIEAWNDTYFTPIAIDTKELNRDLDFGIKNEQNSKRLQKIRTVYHLTL